MAFKFTDIGSQVDKDPAAAAEQLAKEVAARGANLARTAKELGVDYRTLQRWLRKLLGLGHDVRTKALELQADALALAAVQGGQAPALPARTGRPFVPRAAPRPPPSRTSSRPASRPSRRASA